MIFYESPLRLVKTLADLIEFFGETRQCSVSRELTKMFEENRRGSLKEVYEYFKQKTVKGEIVIIVQGKH
jgi:16S rRNA (cytidine1402-2'-O)-methyltransferase